jgi:hypothetical protein
MVNSIKRKNVMWMAPSPLWGEQSSWIRLPKQNQMTRPVILRFANDMFIDEMIAMLTHSPWRFDEWVARPETWRNPMPSPKPVEITRPEINLSQSYNKTKLLVRNHSREKRVEQIKNLAKIPATVPDNFSNEPIKLYHATHQRYYVVTASLVSEEKGYPDYLLNLSNNERATFVVRALVENNEKSYDEYGFVSTSSGMAWRKVGAHGIESASVQRVIPNEEKLPLFPVTYPDRCERFRQIFGGLIPVGKRDEWIDAPAYDGRLDTEIAGPVLSNDGGVDHYNEILYNDVIAPWKALIDQAETEKRKNGITGESFPNFQWDQDAAFFDKIRIMRTARDEIQTSSWYVLHDFARFIRSYLPRVWQEIIEKRTVNPLKISENVLSADELKLVDIFEKTGIDPGLFIELGIENLAVGGFVTGEEVSLWDRLLGFWRLEIFIKLSQVLHESENYSDKLGKKVASDSGMSPVFRQSCLSFLDGFQTNPKQTFLEFAQKFGIQFPILKSVAAEGMNISHQTDESRLITILKKIKLPVVHHAGFKAIEKETFGAAQIDKSMWDLLSFYWFFEGHVDHGVKENVSDTILKYFHADQRPIAEDLSDQMIEWFYGDTESGEWYSFLQFAGDLEDYCPLIHAAAMFEAFGKQPDKDVDDQTEKLVRLLKDTRITDKIHNELYYHNSGNRKIRIIHSLADAMVEILNWSDALEDVDTAYDRSIQAHGDVSEIDERWPDFLFPLTDPEPKLSREQSHIVPVMATENPEKMSDVDYFQNQLDELAEFVNGLVLANNEPPGNGKSNAIKMEPLLKQKSPRFVVRLVFERPRCGNLFPPLVSRATCRLEMAPFFDPDAPARPVRIRMPLDISPAGLRKHKKNALFLLSDILCGKVKKTKKLTLADLVLSVLPWPFHKDLPDIGNAGPCRKNGESLGMFCSLSIPIVTLCAMVLLFIMVNLFNIFFKWIPWFFMCFPLPGLSGFKKKDTE